MRNLGLKPGDRPSWRRLSALALCASLGGCGATLYPEPSDKDMMAALNSQLQQTGFQGDKPGQIAIENPLNGVVVSTEGFEKLGCEKASSGPGYICSYRIAHSVSLHSNENNSAGREHAAAANSIMSLFTGGGPIWDSNTSRFVRTLGGWRVVPN